MEELAKNERKKPPSCDVKRKTPAEGANQWLILSTTHLTTPGLMPRRELSRGSSLPLRAEVRSKPRLILRDA
jgi:hypothetical protein